jgi:MOSC domain-containing protein YiiM
LGEVTKIYLCKVKKEPRIEVEKGFFLENFGLEGDAYSETGVDKQVTIFFDEGRNSLSDEPFPGLCFFRFLETIQIQEIKADDFKTGAEIQIGEVILKVSKPRKKCYSECKIIQDERHCALFMDVRFCRVLQTGTIRKGDSVSILIREH